MDCEAAWWTIKHFYGMRRSRSQAWLPIPAPWAQGQPGVHREFKASLSIQQDLGLKTTKKKKSFGSWVQKKKEQHPKVTVRDNVCVGARRFHPAWFEQRSHGKKCQHRVAEEVLSAGSLASPQRLQEDYSAQLYCDQARDLLRRACPSATEVLLACARMHFRNNQDVGELQGTSGSEEWRNLEAPGP